MCDTHGWGSGLVRIRLIFPDPDPGSDLVLKNLTGQKVRKPGLKFFLRLEYSGKRWKSRPFSMRKPVSYGSYFLKWIIKHAKRNFTKWSWAHVLSPNMDVSDLCKYWIDVCANVYKKWFNFYSEAPEFTSSWFQIFFSVIKHAGI